MSELKETLDRAAAAVRAIRHPNDQALKQALIAVVDALVEIAAVLPAPHMVPKDGL